ncbi:adenylate kinase 1, chloroplastic-like [Camellia sinensis]|uniref:adenylate kinase 1, chloroplastic-like n=1 Tax=Camellia sinensis TaxID=4442 RepID=UPI0010366806|nr:adenylate kinase 1, chloroplastic-like [Camellia sinensis]
MDKKKRGKPIYLGWISMDTYNRVGYPLPSLNAELFEILDEVIDIDLVVNLKLPESVLIEKCLGRRICSECRKNFNVASINVKCENGSPGINMAPLRSPPQCVSKLITRSNDTEAVVKERLCIYNEKIFPE